MTDQRDILARLEATRLELRRARLTASAALDAAQTSQRAQLEDFQQLLNAPARRWLLRQRRRMVSLIDVARHPIGTVNRIGAGVAEIAKVPRLKQAGERARYVASPLRATPFSAREADQSPVDGMIRWLGPLAIGGVARQALFAHPTSTVRWTITIEPTARFVVDCGMVPGVPEPSDPVTFEATVCAADRSWTARAERTLRPRALTRDRRWRRLEVSLPPDAAGPADVVLTTRQAPGSLRDYAWSVWGEPRFLWRRRVPEITRLAVGAIRRDGLRRTLGRMRTADGADPRIAYAAWAAKHALTAETRERLRAEVAALPRQPLVSIVTPVYNTRAKWLRAAIESVRQQVYGRWELLLVDDASTSAETIETLDEYRSVDPRITIVQLKTNSHVSAASNAALDAATGEFIALLDHDDELAPDALAEVARHVNAHPDVDFIYSDEDKLDLGGARCDPYFKPDWAPEHFLNFMYTNHLMVLRRELVETVGRFRIGFEGSQDYDLALRVVSVSDRVGHIPKVLYHWRRVAGSAAAEPSAKPWALAAARKALVEHVERNGLDAEVLDGAAPGLFHVKRRIRGRPLVSIVLTTDDRQRDVNGKLIALLPTAIRSIRQKTLYSNYEIVVIDNGRLSDATQDFLKTVPHRRVSYTIEGEFNFAHKLNFSVRHAAGEHLVLLNDDIEVIGSSWLTAMLEYSQDPGIGAVGAKLYFADGRLQHAGLVLGVSGLAAHVFHQAPGHDPGYAGSTMGPRNYSAVTAACLMTRRAVWDEVGGFNERLAIDFNDVDYCLKVRRAGYRIVFTPYAELYHYESTSHGARTWNSAEVEYMRRAWPEVIARDPYYNVNLTRDFPDYRLGD